MSCTIQYEFDKRDSLKSTKNYLIANNAINKYNSIIDFTKYSNLVGSLNKKGFEEYKFKDKLISSSDRGKVVYFNKNLFSEIDRINKVLKTTPKDVVITNFLNETRLGIDKFGDSNTNLLSKQDSYLNNNVDIDIRLKYFNDGDIQKSSTILKKISKSDHPLNVLAKHLLSYVKANDVDIILNPSDSINEYAGIYYQNTNKIEIVEKSRFRGKGSEPTILHEILHALTYNQLRENTQTKKDFEKLFNYAKSVIGDYNDRTGENYALKNLDEFLVALFTDSNFINKIKNVPSLNITKYKSFLEEVFDYILSLFKIEEKNSFYAEAFFVASNILNESYEKSETLWEGFDSNTNFQLTSTEGKIASEKTIRDLAARMSDRIGIPVRFESDRSKNYKGKLENGVAVVNLAYATLDTVPHEVLSHSIIRALKLKSEKTIESEIDKMIEMGIIKKEC